MIPGTSVEMLASRAADAAATLKLIANEQRLLLLCRLSQGECPVSELVDLSGLSQSAVSQHLGRLRQGGMVRTRREATTIYYRIADQHVHDLIGMLCERFGGSGATVAGSRSLT
jgi:ArsR family transcriptional regulator, virulence genes transcriptional regulator